MVRLPEKKQIVYAFIDSQNLNLSVKNDLPDKKTGAIKYSGWKLDFRKLYIYPSGKYKVSKAFLFIGKMAGNEKLYKYLETSGYSIIYKPAIEVSDDVHENLSKGMSMQN